MGNDMEFASMLFSLLTIEEKELILSRMAGMLNQSSEASCLQSQDAVLPTSA